MQPRPLPGPFKLCITVINKLNWAEFLEIWWHVREPLTVLTGHGGFCGRIAKAHILFFPLTDVILDLEGGRQFSPYLSTMRTHGIRKALTTGIPSDHRKKKYVFNRRQWTQRSPHMVRSKTPEIFSYRNSCWHETNASFVYILAPLDFSN